MAELAVDQPRLLKTMRWWDGFIIGLANPGFLLAGLAGSVVTLGPKWAAIIWFSSAVVGALQAYVYAEPAAMFPDKSGGLSMYAKEGWRKHFSLAGPIATFGYWFAWSSVLAIYGGIIGTLLLSRFWPEKLADELLITQIGFIDVTWPRVIGAVCIASCFIFNIRGMRPAVLVQLRDRRDDDHPRPGAGHHPAAERRHHVACAEHQPHRAERDLLQRVDRHVGIDVQPGGDDHRLVLGDRVVDVRAGGAGHVRARVRRHPQTTRGGRSPRPGALNVVLSLLLPLTIVGMLGVGFIAQDTTYIAYLTTALDQTVGEILGGLFVVFVCAGLLLSMNTATMDGSRALYGMASEGLTFRRARPPRTRTASRAGR